MITLCSTIRTLWPCAALLLGALAASAQQTPAAKPGATPAPTAATRPAESKTESAPAAATERNIRFQFEGIPYADVVERFAQMAGKPLLAEGAVQGTLTYNDPNPYTYAEALDTLNVILSMKGLMLVESGNNLRLVPFKELPSMPLRIMRGSDPTGDVRPGEVVTVVLDVKNVDSKEIADSITAMLSKAGSIAPLSRGRGLIVTDRSSNIQRIRTLLATIDTEATVNRQMKTYTLLHASGAIVADLLNRTFGLATAPKRTTYNPNSKAMEVLPPDPNDYITAVYDDASRTMVLFGPTERLGLAEELINRFEQKDGPGGDVRIYYPQTIKAEELASMLRQAISGVAAPNESASSAATKARLIVDKDQNRLIVAAPIAGQLEQIEQLINRVDKPVHGQTGGLTPIRSQTVQLTKVFRPRSSEATNVAHLLTQALTRRSPSGQMVTTASVGHDAASQSVIVSGTPGDLQIATDIVTQLETGTSQPTPLQTRFIEAGTPDEARKLLPLVEQLYRNQASDGGLGAGAHAKILADPGSGRLIVTANEEHLGRIETLVKQLRSEKFQPQARRLLILPLQNARVESAFASIQNLVSEKMSERAFADLPKPSLISDPTNNRILVTAGEDQIAEIQRIVAVIDVATEQRRREVKVVPLNSKPAAEIIPLVAQLLEQTSEVASNPRLAPKLTADANGRQVIVTAQAKDLDRVESLIRQFDTTTASSAPRQFKGVELHSRTATEFAPLVSQLYLEQIKGLTEPAGGSATLLAEPRSNRIMVSGSEKEIARVESIIRQLDPAEAQAAREETRVMRLKAAVASEISTLVEKSVNARNQQVRVMVDSRSNSLVLNGEPGAVASAAQIIQELDARPESSPREMRILDLRSGDAATVAPVISTLFADMTRDQRRPDEASQTKIVADPAANRLIVTGPRDDVAAVSRLVSQVDQTPEQSGSARVFKLQTSSATVLAPIVSNAMMRFDTRGVALRKVIVSPDDKSNSLIVTGARADVQDAAVIIDRLDGDPDHAENRERTRDLKILPVNSGDADGLAALAMRVFAAQNSGRNITNLLSITPEPAGKRLIVLAPPSMMHQIETVVLALDQPADQAARELHSVELRNANAASLFPMVTKVYEEQSKGKTLKPATLYPDTSGTRLTVWGTKDQAETIRQIVTTLEGESRPARETRVIDLGRLAEAQRLLPLARQLYKDQLSNTPAAGAPDAQFISDGRTGRVVVSARQDQIAAIEQIFAALQKDAGKPAVERETRAFEVGTAADVQRLLPIVQQLYVSHWKDKQDNDPADAQIVGDALSGRIIASGKPDHLKHIEGILGQLGASKPRAAQGDRETRVFDLSTANAVELAATVRTLYLEEAKSRLGNITPDTLILPDASVNRIIGAGFKAELDAVEEIVKKLDKAGAQSASARVFRLKYAEPEKVMEILSTALVRYDAYGRPQKRVSISVDPKTRTLIATGDPKELQAASVIIEQLDSSLGEQADRKMKVVALKTAKVADVAPRLRQLYTDQMRNKPSLGTADALILEDAASNQLILTATNGQLELMEQILGELQQARASLPPRETKLVAVGPAEEVTRLLPLVRQLYQERFRDRSATEPPDAQILPDARGGRFIVTARTNHIAEIEDILSKLQQGGTGPARQTRVLSLERNSAASITAMVSRLFAKQIASTDAVERVIVSPGADDRTLVVDAASPTLENIEQLVRKLDLAEAEASHVIQAVHLKKGNAATLAEAVNQAVAARYPQGLAARLSVTPVNGANSLLVNGPTNHVREVIEIVRELDKESTGDEVQVRVYKLENGNVREVQGVIRQLLQNVSESMRRMRQDGRPVTATVSADERGSSLIVTATDAHFKLVEQVLPTLDKAAERSDRDVQFVWLKKAKALDVVSKVEAVFAGRPGQERPLVEADTMNNSITIIARRADLAQVQDLITRLDDTSRDTTLQVRLRPLERVAADQMARMLQNIYPQMSAGRVRVTDKIASPPATANPAPSPAPSTPPSTAVPGATAPQGELPEVVISVDKDANALILSGPVQELDHIDRIINELTFSFQGNESEFRMFPLKDADPVIVSRALAELLKQDPPQPPQPGQPQAARALQPRITVVAEPRTRSLIVRARPTDFPLLESLIKQLDTLGQVAQIQYRVVALTNAAPQKVLPLVQQMVTQMSLVRPGEPLTVSIDTRSKGLLVIARDSVLSQIEAMIRSFDTPSSFAEAEMRIIPLKKAGATQLVAVLQGMLRPGATGEVTAEGRELQEQVKRLRIRDERGEPVLLDLTQPIRISADPANGQGVGNRIVLTSTASNLKALTTLIEMMDVVAVTEGVSVRLISLQHADAATVSQTLTSIFQQGQRLASGPAGPGARPDGETGKALTSPLNATVDTRSNTLILSGGEEALRLAIRVIDDLDKPMDRFITEVRLFRMKHATATRLAPLLQAVFAEGPAVPGSEGLNTQVSRLRVLRDRTPRTTEAAKNRAALTIQADDLSNTLIIAARGDTLPLITEVIEQLDIPAASGLETVRIYPLNHADPVVIQKVLSDLYTGPRSATVRSEDKPIITIDDRTSSIIVAGNAKSFAIIEGLLLKLDQQLPFNLRDIRILPLEFADATELAATLQRLVDARITQRATANRGAADALKVTILADARSNSLLVGGSRDSFELVETLARQLDKASPALSGQLRVIALRHADARVLASTLTTLFQQRYAAARATDASRNKPVILADPRGNNLLVTANMEDNRSIDDLLKKLDVKLENPSLMLTVLPLKHNDSAKVATQIESIFAARIRALSLPGQAPIPSEQIKIEPDSLNNALIISASKENLELIQGLLVRIDSEPVIPGGVLESFTLQFADAQRLSTILKSLADQGLYRPGLAPGASVKGTSRDALALSVDPRSNTLLVSASPENLSIVREVIKKLDTRDGAAAGDARLYPLRHARASTLATTLTQFFQAKKAADTVAVNAGERLVPVAVIGDDRVNTLLVIGGKDAFDAAERVIQQLDGESVFSRLNFRVFPLSKATAMKLQSTLQQIFANRPPRVRGEPLDPITIVADAWVNALLVGASVEDMGTVESLIQKLDTDAADPGLAVHLFPLTKSDARKVAVTIQSIYREGLPGSTLPIAVTADERMNAIVVSAGENDVRRIGELVAKLDTDQVARVSEIRVFALRYARAETLSGILSTALNTKPAPLTEQSPNAQSVLQFITRTEKGQELVTSALKEAVLITPDARVNSLIVSAPVDYMGLLEQIITRLDDASHRKAKIKVFSLLNADARQTSELLTSMFKLQQTATGTASGQRSIQYTLMKPAFRTGETNRDDSEIASAILGSEEQTALTMSVDPRTNSLLIGGTEDYVALVTQIIDSLDSSPAQERKTEVVRLRNAQAQEVSVAVRTFLDQERQRVTQVLGADAVGTAQRMLEREIAVVAEPTSNTLLVSASPRYFSQVRELIDELDLAQPQVLVQVMIAEVSLDNGLDLGLEWSYNGTPYAAGIELNEKAWITGGFTSAVTGGDYSFLFKMLQDKGRLEVLSRPQIVTADNKPAIINVGQTIPLITDSRVTERGDTINSFRYENVGVNLRVTPRIAPDGFVKLEVGTTNSTVSSSTVRINNNAEVPILNQRVANTTVSVQSGQSILIGGLIGTIDDKRTRKVPVLGDIPGLGYLFKSVRNRKERRELLILLTPQILTKAEAVAIRTDARTVTDEQLKNSKIMNDIKRDEMQKQLLDPIFPNSQPKSGPEPKEIPKKKEKHSDL